MIYVVHVERILKIFAALFMEIAVTSQNNLKILLAKVIYDVQLKGISVFPALFTNETLRVIHFVGLVNFSINYS